MKRILMSAWLLLLAAIPAAAQSLDDLNIQIHGYATQGFIYTNQNNIFTLNSTDGSPAWTEAVVNIAAQPSRRLRVGVQGRYYLLGNLGNEISLDWAQADYKLNNRFGVRFGKVKTPIGMFNEIQDIDPSYTWSMLPQTVYPLESRNSMLSHLGGIAYGSLKLGAKAGDLDYRLWTGELSLGPNDGYFVNEKETGITLTNGMSSSLEGGTLRWRTPVSGLMVGASDERMNHLTGPYIDYALGAQYGVPSGFAGTEDIKGFNQYYLFGKYEGNKLMVAAEYNRIPISALFEFPELNTISPFREDFRAWYGMASYKLTDKFTAGSYYSQYFNRLQALGPGRYLKDWAFSCRYDFNQFLYAKAEQHIMNGTSGQLGLFDYAMNPGGLQPTTKMTILKIGVSF
jgi:hypothetical protein